MRSRQHYVFQNTILGGLVTREPMEIWPRFQPREATRSMRALWRQAGNLVPDQERVAFPEIRCRLTTLEGTHAGHLAVVFTFPTPMLPGEAFMGVIVWRRPAELVNREDADNSMVHPLVYFTLEQSISPSGEFGTRLCAWRLNDRDELEHAHFGPGPRPRVADFLAAAAGLLAGTTSAAA